MFNSTNTSTTNYNNKKVVMQADVVAQSKFGGNIAESGAGEPTLIITP